MTETGTRDVVTQPIAVNSLSPESFAPFGQVIAPTEDGVPFGPEDAALDLTRGTPRFYIMRLYYRGFEITQITRHRQVTQCLASVGGRDWYIAVSPPGNVDDPDAEPSLGDIRAFHIPGDHAIKLHVGTWHAGPFFADQEVSFFNLELADTNIVDHQSCRLDRRYGVKLRLEV